MQQIINLSAAALAKAIRNKEISSTEVVDSYLNRIKEVNPKLNAVVQLSEEAARDQASKADEALSRGDISGPLHGVPFTIKDSFDTAGLISTGGTRGRSNFVPSRDATIVSRLRAAGAILLGKTNTSELTLTYETDNLIYGQTNNPYDLSRSPGGSSGGPAAIVAACGSAFDIGSDYGGSLRFPAHCCGIATIKPTSGRVPRTGHIFPFGGVLDFFQQMGPLARYVDDLSLVLPIISGPDDIDPGIVPMAFNDPKEVALTNLSVAFHSDNGIVSPSPETEKVVRKAAARLEGEGLIITEIRPKGIEQSYDLMIELLSADGGASIRRLLQDAGTKEHTLPWLGLAEPINATRFDALIMKWYQFRSTMLSFFKDYDVIISPVNAFPAMPHGSLGADLEAFSYTMTYNMTGWPAVVVRGGTSPDGLPIGVQIIAHPWREDIGLAVAGYLEKTLGGFQPPPI
ncbi:MAG: amidase [Desulfobacterales bacterium]|nr:amidase [Desulfobacterales bacterium]MDD4392921.1 amidase [Desulfobacterales bacterium]